MESKTEKQTNTMKHVVAKEADAFELATKPV